ncbi:MAG: AhpC/TSA family protein [Bacteroidales bacterium]|nr:AhpC/TSA family protein [Bacteroidales bacterium]
MKGTLEGVKNDSLVVEYRQYEPVDSLYSKTIAVRNGKFKYKAKTQFACLAFMHLKSKHGKGLTFYVVPGEEAIFSGKLNDKEAHWDGTAFFKQYQRLEDQLNSIRKEYEEIRKEKREALEAGVDEATVDSITESKSFVVADKWMNILLNRIEEHPDEDASATDLFVLGINYDLDTIVAKFTPEVRNGRMRVVIDKELAITKKLKTQMAAHKAVGNDTVALGDLAPELNLMNPQGDTLKLESLRGKYVILDFWGSWCTWCIKGFPKLKEYYAAHRDRIEIVGVDCNDTKEKWEAAIETHKIPWLNVRSEDATTEVRYKVEGFPFKVVISPKGEILKSFLGNDDDFFNYMDELL